MKNVDVVIIGASAAGLMCAIEAAKRSRKVIVVDHSNKAGKKILLSGGGKCNFTNLDIDAENYLSNNPHFCKSALNRYSQWDFISMVDNYQIPYHERLHGQLFCNRSAKDILNMLLSECERHHVKILLNTAITGLYKNTDNHFEVILSDQSIHPQSVVVATGGLSFPTMGATPFGYQLAAQFGINVIPVCAALVPFTLHTHDKNRFAPLSGIAVDALVTFEKQSFRENILFTHRGLSGPAILQISSYWRPGKSIEINLLPDTDLMTLITHQRDEQPNIHVKTLINQHLPKRLVSTLLPETLLDSTLHELSREQIIDIAHSIQHWKIKPNGTEGYRTAEVTKGGVDCHELSSKTMESIKVKGLFFIGEVVDVTGWLGGYNFQWAWSSGWCAGQYV
jgi:predicted Rossmann fold flavoprotein